MRRGWIDASTGAGYRRATLFALVATDWAGCAIPASLAVLELDKNCADDKSQSALGSGYVIMTAFDLDLDLRGTALMGGSEIQDQVG